jgi:glycosyltransferase involved in cell wall biosynthesis
VPGGDAGGLVAYRHDRPASAIDEYSRHLVRALRAAGVAAGYEDGGLSGVLGRATPPRWILLQYNPLSYGRWGFAPGLVRDAISVRRRWPRTPLVVTVHEPWLAIRDWRSALMVAYQRVQLRLLLRAADGVIVVRETLGRELGRTCAHIPVGSNIVPTAVSSAAARARLGIEDKLVVALFGTRHESRALDHAEAAIAALGSEHGPDRLCVLNLGRGSPVLAIRPDVEVRMPGALASTDLSLHLRASDVLLLPFTDGLSTRRTTLMAGLAHGVPVAGLRGVNTDGILVRHADATVMTPYRDLDAYARAAVELTADRARLGAIGAAGRELYKRNFDWPVVARMVIAALRTNSPSNADRGHTDRPPPAHRYVVRQTLARAAAHFTATSSTGRTSPGHSREARPRAILPRARATSSAAVSRLRSLPSG